MLPNCHHPKLACPPLEGFWDPFSLDSRLRGNDTKKVQVGQFLHFDLSF